MDVRVKIAVALLALLALGGTRDPSVDDSAYIGAGAQHAGYTLALDAVDLEDKLGCGTAVAIADTWVLTAAHIVHDAKIAVVRNNRRSWLIKRIVCHSGFRHALMGEHDIALLETDEPLGLEFYPPLSDGTEEVGDSVVVAGYGATGTLSSGWSENDGKLRAGTNTICRRERSLWICHGAAGTSSMEILVAPGDSGGPMLSRGRVVGINSLVMREGKGSVRSTTGQESGHTRVGDYVEWIKSVTSGGEIAWTP